MKTITIRFIKYKDKYRYTIQRRGWFGWKDITYTLEMGYGSVTYEYSAVTKEELLNEVLEKYYEVDKKFVQVIEHATIKVY
jgi:hypothetical protein